MVAQYDSSCLNGRDLPYFRMDTFPTANSPKGLTYDILLLKEAALNYSLQYYFSGPLFSQENM